MSCSNLFERFFFFEMRFNIRSLPVPYKESKGFCSPYFLLAANGLVQQYLGGIGQDMRTAVHNRFICVDMKILKVALLRT